MKAKWSEVVHLFLFCFHIRPLLTPDTWPLDHCFVQSSGASLLSTKIRIPSRCSHLRGCNVVSCGQREKQLPSTQMNKVFIVILTYICLFIYFCNSYIFQSLTQIPKYFWHSWRLQTFLRIIPDLSSYFFPQIFFGTLSKRSNSYHCRAKIFLK